MTGVRFRETRQSLKDVVLEDKSHGVRVERVSGDLYYRGLPKNGAYQIERFTFEGDELTKLIANGAWEDRATLVYT